MNSASPKVTPADLEAQIQTEVYFNGADTVLRELISDGVPATKFETGMLAPLKNITVCVLVLKNGLKLVGVNEGPVSAANFDPELGKQYAREKALDQLWPLLGYQLKTKLDMIEKAGPPTGRIAGEPTNVATYVGTKVVRAVPMDRQLYNDLRGWIVPQDENPSDEGYLVEYVDGGKTNVEGFTGYISWSPRDVFERAYGVGVVPEPSKPLTRAQRLSAEYGVVDGNVQRLTEFVNTNDIFKSLDRIEQDDLIAQHHHMKEYRWFLGRRLNRALDTDRG